MFNDQGHILNIPDEILLVIFQQLYVKDLLNLKRVCRRFYNLTKHCLLWREVDLYPSIVPVSNLYKIMKNNFVSDTRTLKLRGYVEVFKGKPKWVKQVWTKCFLAHLAQKCPQLKKLCLVEANIDQSVIMTDLPISVCVLQLCSCHISHGQRFFRVPPRQKIHLIELDLSNSVGVSDAALGHIANLETLRVLRLYNCQVVKDSGLQYFADHLTNLQCLNLGRTFITDTSLHLLSQHHTKLTELTLINCHVTRNGIMDLISSLKSLKTLNMQLTLVNEEEMTSVIERFPLVTIVCK